jgi:hypothetical protein
VTPERGDDRADGDDLIFILVGVFLTTGGNLLANDAIVFVAALAGVHLPRYVRWPSSVTKARPELLSLQ